MHTVGFARKRLQWVITKFLPMWKPNTTSTQKETEFSCDKNDKLQVFFRTFVGHENLI